MKQLHIQPNKTIGFIACLLSLGIVLTSCSSDDEQEENTDGRKLRQLTINDVSLTRATLKDNGTSLEAKWKVPDHVTYFNLNTFGYNTMDYGYLTASENAAISSLTGSVRCGEGDQLALFYPAKDPIPTGENRGKFTISLAGQIGTLDDIAKNFHYVYGVTEKISVTEATATANVSTMKSLLAVCKFTFVDGNNAPIPVETLSIGYGDDSYAGYPQTYELEPKVYPTQVTVPTDLSPSGDLLTVSLDPETSDGVYVALFPVSSLRFYFSVTGSNGTYTGTAEAKLNAGAFYPATLKLTKQQVTQQADTH